MINLSSRPWVLRFGDDQAAAPPGPRPRTVRRDGRLVTPRAFHAFAACGIAVLLATRFFHVAWRAPSWGLE